MGRFRGVYSANGRYRAQIWDGTRTVYLGEFVDEIDGVRAYNEMAIELFGAAARLNDVGDGVPPEPESGPSPAEIARACEAIRAGWSGYELARRAGAGHCPADVPLVGVRDLLGALESSNWS